MAVTLAHQVSKGYIFSDRGLLQKTGDYVGAYCAICFDVVDSSLAQGCARTAEL